jgi:hypothetical protein
LVVGEVGRLDRSFEALVRRRAQQRQRVGVEVARHRQRAVQDLDRFQAAEFLRFTPAKNSASRAVGRLPIAAKHQRQRRACQRTRPASSIDHRVYHDKPYYRDSNSIVVNWRL